MPLKCALTDDEPIARRGLQRYIDKIDFLEVVATCEDALQLDTILMEEELDLVFLDINMPQLSGIDFLKGRKITPKVIITTAYPEYALEGYELDVLDYLVKPISFDRFFKAAVKAREYFEVTRLAPTKPAEFFFLKCDQRLEKVIPAEVLFVESMQNYVRIHLPERTLTAHATLKSIQEELPADSFIHPHRSFLVNAERVQAIDGNRLIVGEHKIPISKYRKEEVLARIVRGKLFEK